MRVAAGSETAAAGTGCAGPGPFAVPVWFASGVTAFWLNPTGARNARGLAIAGPLAFFCLSFWPLLQKSAVLQAVAFEAREQQETANGAAQEQNSQAQWKQMFS